MQHPNTFARDQMYVLLLVLVVVSPTMTLDNGLALTPPMGWLTWQRERLIRRTADIMAEEGYLEAGYNYIAIDDCWLEKQRSPDGKLVADRDRFPHGMKQLAKYWFEVWHIRRLWQHHLCSVPGVMGHEQTDVDTLLGWDVDYIKLDGCAATPDDMKTDYGAIAEHCNLWRNWDDIDDSWASVSKIMNWFGDNQQRIQQYAGPGHWNDPDMLVIGNYGLSLDQARAQMAVWAVLAAPLLMSADLARMRPEFKEILLNRDIIAMYVLLLVLGVVSPTMTLDNGLALTPPMGWLTWQRYRCKVDCNTYPDDCISEQLIRRTADIMAEEGYLEAGYNYIAIDDCWLEKQRSPDGKLVADRDRFPHGMKQLAKYVHHRGLKFGIYEDYGNTTCALYPGVMGHEQTDVDTLLGWDVDYIKLDGCAATPDDMKTDYGAIAEHCNLWRNWDDIDDSWASVSKIMNWFGDNQQRIQQYAGPGHWNDPDMLVIGNYGLSLDQARAQMAVWAVLAAPLLMSADLARMRPEFKEILLNRDIIAVNQDSLGKQGLRVSMKAKQHVWTRELSGDSYAVAIVNHIEGGPPQFSSLTFSEMAVPARSYTVQDLYHEEEDWILFANQNFTTRVNPTGVKFYQFVPLPSEERTRKSNINLNVQNELDRKYVVEIVI
ncbi:hypothetical protein MSG28_008530 [Choristoneura fumiferana]|uniref:Uncharacterized protein n=1 Tax=Choristoneura fumiferana TaxID=7141 RepID=A0ACC0J737_CHOFU|nr:hypothetical protein MSG28_008530 [Choristoneura fumiferana]